jgi:hypothetical protein
MKRMTHPDLPDTVIEVPESAVPIHAASGWVAMSKKDAEAYDRQAVEEARAADAAMTEAAVATLPPELQPEPEPEPEPVRESTSKKENS